MPVRVPEQVGATSPGGSFQGRNPRACLPGAQLGLGLRLGAGTRAGGWAVCVWDAAQMATEGGPDESGPGGLPGRGIQAGECPEEGVAGGHIPLGGTLVRSLQFTVYLSTEEDRWGPPYLLPPLQAAPALQCPLNQGHTCCPGLSPVLRRVWSLSAPSPGCMQSALNACRDELWICFLRVHTSWRVAGSLQHTQLDCPLCPLPQAGSRRFCVGRPSSMGPTTPGPR